MNALRPWTRNATALTALCLAAASCRGFAPTIPQRARRAEPPVELPAPVDVGELVIDEDPFEVEEPARLEPSPIGGDELVSFQLRGMPLASALHLVAEQAGVNIYLDASLDRQVDAAFPSVTLDDALHALLSRNGLRLMEEPAGIYWVAPGDGSEHETARFRVHSVDAGSLRADLEKLVSSQTALVVNEEQNLILVDGTARDASLVEVYLDSVDRLKRQVLLEVELVELTLDDNFELGFAHAITDADIDGPNLLSLSQALATGSGEFSLSLDNSSIPLSSTLTALQQYVGLSVISSPRVLVTTKSPAKVEVITEVPYIQATVTSEVGGGQAGAATTEEIEFKEVGLTMTVTPTIQEGGRIEIIIEQKFSNVIEFFQSVPVVDSRNISTVMLVENQHTAVLGGLIENSVMEDDSGVPLLMDIPLLGRLFRSDVDASARRQLLVFITPRIVDPNQGAALAERYRHDYRETLRASGLTSAEE